MADNYTRFNFTINFLRQNPQQAALHEQSENRWLRIIDKTRQEGKDSQKKMEKLCETKDVQIKNLTAKLSELQKVLFENKALAKLDAQNKKSLEQENTATKSILTKHKRTNRKQTHKEINPITNIY